MPLYTGITESGSKIFSSTSLPPIYNPIFTRQDSDFATYKHLVCRDITYSLQGSDY